MSSSRRNLGQEGEDIAAAYLKKHRYKILNRNFRTRFGEIDIIAKDRGTIVFIEVKSRTGTGYGTPACSVTLKKQRQISRVALLYISEHNLGDVPARFDVVSVLFDGGSSRVELITDAFELCY